MIETAQANPTDYDVFINRKRERAAPTGFTPPAKINPNFFPYQAAVHEWGLSKGNFLGALAVGMGKTILQVEDAKQKQYHYGGKVLFIAPLAVSHQTILEAKKFCDVDIIYVQSKADVDAHPKNVFFITNQEHVIRGKYYPDDFTILVLDEASKMLKAFRGKARNELTYRWGPVPHKTAWTATPSPNKLTEMLNYAEFLGIKSTGECLTRWFKRDSKQANMLSLNPHGEDEFWEWLASWCVVAGKPSDLGFSDDGYILPPRNFIYEDVKTDMSRAFTQQTKEGQFRLIPDSQNSATDIWKDKRLTIWERAKKVVEIVNREPDKNWFILTDTDAERDTVAELLPGCTVVTGSQPQRIKEERLLGFAEGTVKWLLTKPDIAGYGLNFQYHCNNMILMGLTHRWEIIHQVMGRIYRFGQTETCNVYIILADSEIDILANIERKQRQYETLQANMIPAMKITGVLAGAVSKHQMAIEPHNEVMILPDWLKTQDERIVEYAR